MLSTKMNNDLGGPKTIHNNYHDHVGLVDGIVEGIVNGIVDSGHDVLFGVFDVRAFHLYRGVGLVVTVVSGRHNYVAVI